MSKEKLLHWYEKNVMKLIFVTIALVLFAFIQIGMQFAATGDFVNKGVSLKGGSSITINQVHSVSDLQAFLETEFPRGDVQVRSINQGGKQIGLTIDADAQEEEEINFLTNSITTKLGLTEEDYTVEVIGSSLGKSFFRQTITALLVAFFLMGLVVLIYFRSLVPSIAVIAAAASDLIVTVSIFNLTGISLSTAGVAAFLMLIGYSVDTDMLLTTKVLKRKHLPFMQRVEEAMKTGVLMTTTTLTVILIALIFVKSVVIKQIMVILLIGLIVDFFMTWIQNVAILKWYLKQ
ncbi:MAG: hypothetical protein CMH61_01580 [Nanoarchaeota archaeon]|nr:hypothetical protein [Nanoarchaeota archaeon]|tara:strand:- start:2214 stop:3086 length:873 start_codon:yes stop_codon:yes gene_type:complete